MSNGEGAENLQPPDIQLKEWVAELIQNPDEDQEFQNWAKICQENKTPTIVAAIDQYYNEVGRARTKRMEQVNAMLSRARGEPWVDIVEGLDIVRLWLRDIKYVFGRSEESLSLPAEGNLADHIGDFLHGKIKPMPEPPIMKDPLGGSYSIEPLPRAQQEQINQERRFLKSFLAQDPSGIRALNFLLQSYRNGLNEAREADPTSYRVRKGRGELIGIEMGVQRFQDIFNGIEQASWGSPNPHIPQK